jgi:outer membrane lipoprotein carrier protein
MNRLYVFCLLVVCSLSAYCQHKASAEQQRVMYQRITAASASIRTLQCRFVQTKDISALNSKITSKGVMYYRQSSQLRWEYTSPFNYIFLISNGKVMMKSDKSSNIIDVRSSKLFQEITRVMISSVNGTGLKDGADYNIVYYDESSVWRIVLFPKSKVMKRMFSSIVLFVSPVNYQVEKVVMVEANNDRTTISLTDRAVNRPINDEKFFIR